jgi:plasmid stability protein
MPELLLTNVEESVLSRLHERAARHRRTPAEEAAAILIDTLNAVHGANWSQVDAIYQRLTASGRQFSDSADMLREDRDR